MDKDLIDINNSTLGLINYFISYGFFLTKVIKNPSTINERISTALICIVFVNLFSVCVCFFDWEEGVILRLCKSLAAFGVFSQVLLLWLTTNEWSERFIRMMILNILAYIPFVLSYVLRISESTNRRRGPLCEMVGIISLSVVIAFNSVMNGSELIMIAGLSIATLIPNAFEQTICLINRRAQK